MLLCLIWQDNYKMSWFVLKNLILDCNNYLHTVSSSRKVDLIYAHSLFTTLLSSAAVLAALICLMRSRSRIGVGIRTKKNVNVTKNTEPTFNENHTSFDGFIDNLFDCSHIKGRVKSRISLMLVKKNALRLDNNYPWSEPFMFVFSTWINIGEIQVINLSSRTHLYKNIKAHYHSD